MISESGVEYFGPLTKRGARAWNKDLRQFMEFEMSEAKGVRPTFKALEFFRVPTRGLVVYVVENDRECSDFTHLLHKQVEIDGAIKYVHGVERFAHAPPWKKGERIGVAVED